MPNPALKLISSPLQRFQFLPVLLCIALPGITPASAQTFRFEAPVQAPQADGYYRLNLPVQVPGLAKPDLADLRLQNGQKQAMPYLPGKAGPAVAQARFMPLPIQRQQHTPGCCTELIVENPAKLKLNGLHLRIGNAEVQKTVELTGSEDGQKWFVVKAKSPIRTFQNPTGTTELQLLGFPLNDYRLFRFTISDSASAPLRILEAGYYSSPESTQIPWQLVQAPQVSRSDSAAATWLLLTWPQPQLVERLSFTVQHQPLFFRQAQLVVPRQQTRRKQTYWQTLQSFSLSPTDTALLLHQPLQTDSVWLQILNEDNPALSQLSLMAWQQPRYLVAYLQAGQNYWLRFGNDSLTAPRYDLARFAGELPQNLPELAVAQPVLLAHAVTEEPAKTGTVWWKSKVVIWAALGVVAALLLYMVTRLLRDMQSKTD